MTSTNYQYHPEAEMAGAGGAEKGNGFAVKIEDMLMFLCVWGEAANLRYMPEALCFLYHKTTFEHFRHRTEGNIPSRYPGYFLDHIISPIYEVVSSSMKQKGDHKDRKNYDDFNEFFWSPACLKYSLHHTFMSGTLGDMEEGANSTTSDSSRPLMGAEETVLTVAEGMRSAKKTYTEKRSWLHVIFSMHRVLEWHIICFTIQVAWGLATDLVWDFQYTLQVISFVFWELVFMNILWICADIWTLFPQAYISESSVYGYVLRLAGAYMVLIYQTIYYHWSYTSDKHNVIAGLRQDGTAEFWWCQYIWISIAVLSVYFIESILSLWPEFVSGVLNTGNIALQALLNICYPISQLYVGKNVHAKRHRSLWYVPFWLSLICFKLWFGYRYVVHPMCAPSVEVFDDYMNFEGVSLVTTGTQFCIFWAPHFMVYLIDMSIWYSIWSSVVGGYMALASRQGAVRNFRTLRGHFMRAPHAYCFRMMHQLITGGNSSESYAASGPNVNRSVSRMSLENLPTLDPSSRRAMQSQKLKAMAAENRKDPQMRQGFKTYEPDAPFTHEIHEMENSMTDFLDVRSLKWVVFARVWNEVIDKLRDNDHLSDAEREIYLFSHFDWLSKPVYLPLFQTVGLTEQAMHELMESVQAYAAESDLQQKLMVVEQFHEHLSTSTLEAVGEAWELSCHLLSRLLGAVHEQDIQRILNTIGQWAASDDIYFSMELSSIPTLMTQLISVVNSLKSAQLKRSKSPVVDDEKRLDWLRLKDSQSVSKAASLPKGAAMKRSVSTGFLSFTLTHDTSPTEAVTNLSDLAKQQVSLSKKVPASKMTPFRKAQSLVDNLRDKLRDILRNLFNTLRSALRSKQSEATESDLLDRITFVLSMENGFMANDLYASMQIDTLCSDEKMRDVLSKLSGLLSMRSSQVELASNEARRRLHFFINSLFMDMPITRNGTRFSKDVTIITPFYSEDVLLSKKDLLTKNEDGINVLLYLQTLYKKDWLNFLERLGLQDDADVFRSQYIMETRMWASLRAQTLFRTVEGVMHNEAAIRLSAELENLSSTETDILCKLKFNYVVACQVYGNQKKNLDSKADDIEFLLSRHLNLRVAYIDSVRINREGDMNYYSVLVKATDEDCGGALSRNLSTNSLGAESVVSVRVPENQKREIKEVFRVKLPGNPILGEGKPENQNHAIIFTRGRYLQAMDMNQDAYFEEALKSRNMLEEFEEGFSIVGFREHIFTGSVSSVANYMALQELSFGSLGQRVLADPLCVRQHYGHPDMFDKMFVVTEGGMSKGSKGINLSEDVFAGFNATIRGKSVGFKEYMQVGKGRDVGLQQTYKFEAKLAQGNAEQCLSRDMSRICDRLDFFRLFSFYYGGVGHYISSALVMICLVLVVYIMAGQAVFGAEGINGRKLDPEGTLQILLAGLGILQTGPLFTVLTVEKGMSTAVAEVSYMILSGGPLYFIFQIQTKAYYFLQTIMAGGAMYRPTGRGFVTRHAPFDESFRFFAFSHLHTGFEMLAALIITFYYTKSKQYIGLTWAPWLAVISFLVGPFWFNPLSFETPKLAEDYSKWWTWMTETGGSADQSWIVWWQEETAFVRRLSLSWKAILLVMKSLMWVVLSCGIFGRKFFSDQGEQVRVLELVAVAALYWLLSWFVSRLERSVGYAGRRLLNLFVTLIMISLLGLMVFSHPAYLRYIIAMYYASATLAMFLLVVGYPHARLLFRTHDILVGHFLFSVLFIMAVCQVGYIQTWLLYHNALSSGVVIEDILKYARKTKEVAHADPDSTEQIISELRAQVAEQGRQVRALMNRMTEQGPLGCGEGTRLLTQKDLEMTGGSGSGSSSSGGGYGTTRASTQLQAKPNVLVPEMPPLRRDSGVDSLPASPGDATPVGSLTSNQGLSSSGRSVSSGNLGDFMFSQPSKMPPRM
jgi:callose synthase